MTSDNHPYPHRSRALLLLCGLPIALAGCDQRGPTARAVQTSATQLQAVSDGVGPPPGDTFTRSQYSGVVNTLKSVSDQGQPGENAAALVITSRAQFGLAQAPAAEASTQESESLNRALIIRSMLSAWTESGTLASSREAFDPSKLIAESRKNAEEKKKLAELARQTKARIDEQIAAFRAQAQAKNTEAKAQDEQYAGLKEQATKLTAIKAEPLTRQAAEHKRAADRLRTEAQMLEARADQIAPQSAEAQLQIDQFTNQAKNHEAMAAHLEQRSAAYKDEAQKARAQAANIAAQIDKAVVELREQRTGPLNTASQEAASLLQSAASTAQRAGGPDPSPGKLAVGAAQQALGDLHWSRAGGLESFRVLLDTLAKAQPPLPEKARYAKEAEEAGAARKESLEAAKAAYEAAQAAFSAVRTRGESKDRLDRLVAQLEKVAKYTGGESTDTDFTKPLPPPADEAAGQPAADTAAAPAASEADLLTAVDQVFATLRAKKYADLGAQIHAATPAEKAMVDSSVKFLTAFARIDDLTSSKFGQSLTDYAREAAKKSDPAAPVAQIVVAMHDQMSLGSGAIRDLKASDAKVALAGDTATVTFPGGQPMTFHLVNGKWLMGLGMDRLPEAQRDVAAKALPAMAEAVEGVVTDVESGRLQSNQAVLVSLLQKLQPVLAELMKNMQPPGGGGGG